MLVYIWRCTSVYVTWVTIRVKRELGLALKLNKGSHIPNCSATLEVSENIFINSVMLVRAEKSKMASKMATVYVICDQNKTCLMYC